MGMDLAGAGGYFRASNDMWRALLVLANKYGWEPAGTKPPEPATPISGPVLVDVETLQRAQEEWDGSYLWNANQQVTDEDAANMADALERARPHIPEGEPSPHLFTPEEWQRFYSGELPEEVYEQATKRLKGMMEEHSERAERGEVEEIDPTEEPERYLAGDDAWLEAFIRFCRVGGFSIG
jgi:hypothetical protein